MLRCSSPLLLTFLANGIAIFSHVVSFPLLETQKGEKRQKKSIFPMSPAQEKTATVYERRVSTSHMSDSLQMSVAIHSRYFFFQVAPQLYSRGRVDPVPDPLLLRKPGSAENRTVTSGFVARNSDHYITEAVYFLLHNKYKFSSYLAGSTIHLRCVARNSDLWTTEVVYFLLHNI
jgi:hypothetical protein